MVGAQADPGQAGPVGATRPRRRTRPLGTRLSWLFVAYFVGFALMVAVAVPTLAQANNKLGRLQNTIAPARQADQVLDQALVDQENGRARLHHHQRRLVPGSLPQRQGRGDRSQLAARAVSTCRA